MSRCSCQINKDDHVHWHNLKVWHAPTECSLCTPHQSRMPRCTLTKESRYSNFVYSPSGVLAGFSKFEEKARFQVVVITCSNSRPFCFIGHSYCYDSEEKWPNRECENRAARIWIGPCCLPEDGCAPPSSRSTSPTSPQRSPRRSSSWCSLPEYNSAET